MWRLVIASVFAVALAISLPGSCGGGPTGYGRSYRLEKCVLTGRRSFHRGNHHLSEERSLHATQHPLRRVVPPHTGEAICSTQAVSVDGWRFGLVVAHFWEVP
jgi:hypothetical protein